MLGWILIIAEATGKLTRWWLRMSEFESDIIHCAGIKHQAADALLRLKTNGEDKSSVDDEVQVLTVHQKVFACAPQTQKSYLEFIREPDGQFIPFNLKACIIASITYSKEEELPTVTDLFRHILPTQTAVPRSRTSENRILVSLSIAAERLLSLPLRRRFAASRACLPTSPFHQPLPLLPARRSA